MSSTLWDSTNRPISAAARALLAVEGVETEVLDGGSEHDEYVCGNAIESCLACQQPIEVGEPAKVYEDGTGSFFAAAHISEVRP